MLEDMNVRRFTANKQRVRACRQEACCLAGPAPGTATAEELRAYQVHLTEIGVMPLTINATVTALQFFFKGTLDRPETTRHLVFM
jgi:integrase/recombinase XerD